ncbi:HAMP domain-containing sensor histidine kinase [Collinsella tanakaei]|uniref:sensor histidine kinase n=1 Tax=Collinsella tanakaei TaxID=626935 RepID=UPI0025A46733|nr:HAMP domain-containing sensor histidine kinase [Collinsella tanakaei]MDM8245715.1 HAMP domain-containing sensor histidine kinase [Collinsella tanakaei]
MARLANARRNVRDRLKNCSIKTAFLLYAAAGILVALALSFVSMWLLSTLALSTLDEDPYSYTGTFVYDRDRNELVPAESLSWYEMSAFDAAESMEAAPEGSDVVLLYIESARYADSKPIDLDDPPTSLEDGSVLGIAISRDGTTEANEPLLFSDIAAYDAQARSERAGAQTADALAQTLPDNADGSKPVVSNVGYYVPYPGDPLPYRTIADIAIASVPVIFVICLALAGRRFYRNRLQRPIETMDDAARRIAADDLDFTVDPQRPDELGRLCSQFETMRSELAASKRTLWRAAENRRQVNAAFAHDLRTPLTVMRGQAQMIQKLSDVPAVQKAAQAIERHAVRLGRYAESMSSIDSLETAELTPAPMDVATWFNHMSDDFRSMAAERDVQIDATSEGLPARIAVDAQALSNVADNLVANALRHARNAVEVSCTWQDNALTFTVTDDGPGFSQAATAHALEPFWRDKAELAAAPATRSEGHLGLGLYICRLLCEKHRGNLIIGNSPNGGARVTARLLAPAA